MHRRQQRTAIAGVVSSERRCHDRRLREPMRHVRVDVQGPGQAVGLTQHDTTSAAATTHTRTRTRTSCTDPTARPAV
jgi:hypothetical protein